jgi:hypothetical protein
VIKLPMSDEALLICSLLCAALPLGILALMIAFHLGALGGLLLNPVNLSAYLWLGLTIAYYRRTRTRLAKWLFALFPIAFALPVWFALFWLWGRSGRP